MTYDEVLATIRSLRREQQLLLYEVLRYDLFPIEIDDELLAEVERRSDLYDQGKMTAVPWSEVRDRARRAAGLKPFVDE
jgi:putative addiction module component (TIGR02574 family)